MNSLNQRVSLASAKAFEYANIVDNLGTFPQQAIDALKEFKLLGAMVPTRLGGEGLSPTEIASICFSLGESCGSTALIYAMHQIEVAMLLPEHDEFSTAFLKRIAGEQLLLASVTSEEGVGGSVRTSLCAVEPTSDTTFKLYKKATTISYGGYADGLLITCRKAIESQAGDQVLVTATKDQYTLEQTSTWDTLGMRGTCSHGYNVTVHADSTQICSTPFGEIAESIMLPVSHMFWASVWLGIASNACTRARAYLRDQIKRTTGNVPPPGSNRLVDALSKVHFMHARIKNALELYEGLNIGINKLPRVSVGFTTEMNGLKTSISQMALEVVDEALMVCGISGYKNETQYSLGRHLRDVHSARLMISNDRIIGNMASFLIVQRSPVVVF